MQIHRRTTGKEVRQIEDIQHFPGGFDKEVIQQ